MDSPMTNRAGLEFHDPGFHRKGRFALEALFRLPPSIRESLFFSSSGICLSLQKMLRRSLGGAFELETCFTRGPLSNYRLRCWSSEKYFILGSSFEQDFQQLLAQIVLPDDTVYDVGAHIGYTALLLSALCGQHGRVFAFEPSSINFPRLKRNIELNLMANIVGVQSAASDKEGTARLLENGSMSSIASGEIEDSDGERFAQTLRLDDFVYRDGNPPPSFVKIDIEGHAGPCLSGMQRILRERRPSIVLEVHNAAELLHVMRILRGSHYNSETIDKPNEFPSRMVARPQ